MKFVLRRRLNSFGMLRGCKKNFATNITVAFFKGEEFLKWKIENGKWKNLRHDKNFSDEDIRSISTKTPFNILCTRDEKRIGGSS